MNRPTSPPDQDDEQSPPAYEVGYRKPPIATRFKPGQSGNPRGRPKPILRPAEMLRVLLNKPVTVREGDKKLRMTKLELLLNTTINAAIQRERGAFASLMALLKLLPEALEFVTASAATKKLSSDDIAVLQAFLSDVGSLPTEPGDEVSTLGNGAAQPTGEGH